MSWSLGLMLYTLGAQSAPEAPVERIARPAGRLVCLVVSGPEALRPMTALAERLMAEAKTAVLMTLPGEAAVPRKALTDQPPAETPTAVRAFLDHWHPEILVLAEGELRPLLLQAARDRGIPAVMVDGRQPRLPPGRRGWWPGLIGASLDAFDAIVTVDEPSARDFRRAGAAPTRLRVLGRMEQPSAALACLEAERAALARLLSTRPVWFAALPPEAEEGMVIIAHRSALRLAHRMLLIVAPADPARAVPFAEKMAAVEGWSVARRTAEEEPDAEVQVYVVDSSELGLWLRLAPITYLGGSLTSGGALLDPAYPAALGSAIIHGPRAGQFGATVGRLAAAQATALVGSAADLAEAVGELTEPDRAARFARAAWTVTSDGAEVTDEVLTLIRDLMERPR